MEASKNRNFELIIFGNNKNFIESLNNDLLTCKINSEIHTYTADNLDKLELRSKDENVNDILSRFYPHNYNLQSLEISKDLSWKLFFWKYIYLMPEAFGVLVYNSKDIKRQKTFIKNP